jgi:hypothetical protein
MNFYAVVNIRRRKEGRGGAVHEIPAIAGQASIAAGKLETVAGAIKNQVIAIINRLKNGFQFVKPVGTFAEDVQEQVDFAG